MGTITLPSSLAESFCEILVNCGFKVNSKKSHWQGAFRESCGKHYFQGVDVTPFYVRKPIDSVDRYYWLVNSLRLWSQSDPVLEPLATEVESKLPDGFRNIFVPLSAGSDVGLFKPWDVAVATPVDHPNDGIDRARGGCEGWLYPYLSEVTELRDLSDWPRFPYLFNKIEDSEWVNQRLLKALYLLEAAKGESPDQYSDRWTFLKLLPASLRKKVVMQIGDEGVEDSRVPRSTGLYRLNTGRRRALAQRWIEMDD
jgi:hypothetical protein